MRTRDLFAGCFVTMMPQGDVWIVGLHHADRSVLTMHTYAELRHAMESAQQWMLMLSDDAEISSTAAAAADLMRITLAHYAIGNLAELPKSLDEIEQRDELRTWFEREMGD